MRSSNNEKPQGRVHRSSKLIRSPEGLSDDAKPTETQTILGLARPTQACGYRRCRRQFSFAASKSSRIASAAHVQVIAVTFQAATIISACGRGMAEEFWKKARRSLHTAPQIHHHPESVRGTSLRTRLLRQRSSP